MELLAASFIDKILYKVAVISCYRLTIGCWQYLYTGKIPFYLHMRENFTYP